MLLCIAWGTLALFKPSRTCEGEGKQAKHAPESEGRAQTQPAVVSWCGVVWCGVTSELGVEDWGDRVTSSEQMWAESREGVASWPPAFRVSRRHGSAGAPSLATPWFG